ncbi:MAG: hypothetical protein H7Y32_01110, partial [Chloroflexales bacterium]|nr:hypothetical protein [Chloroflexales bacterium]
SNRHLKLEPVLAALAADAGLAALMNDNIVISREDGAKGKSASQWALLARAQTDLGPLATTSGWQPARGAATGDVWTDDYSSLLRVFSWR